jgi:oxygen-independent coproporphyrinogen III oxidase
VGIACYGPVDPNIDTPAMIAAPNASSQPATCPSPAGVYIHVPFCRAKCPYCDFYSVTERRLIPDYIEALHTELALRRRSVPCADTVYFGGGTPSMLAPRQIGSILDSICGSFSMESHPEVTLEVNPGTVNADNLADYRIAGVNRLNIGLQSIDDQNLVFLGRIHTAGQGLDTLRWARQAGFQNVGLDLIYAIPGQTRKRWESELAEVVRLAPDHLSCYTLTIEPGTPMAARVQKGDIQPLDEKTAGDLFSFSTDYLNRNGYRQYEISNFARDAGDGSRDNRSRHNRKYWTLAPYLGFGPAAHSFLDNRRWWNHDTLHPYLSAIKAGELPVAGAENLTFDQQMIEFIYLGLRQTDGIDTSAFASRFNAAFCGLFEPQVSRLLGEGLLEKSLDHIRLTARGMRFLESVAGRLITSTMF